MEVRSTGPISQGSIDYWIAHRMHRSSIRPFFTRERISHFDLFDRIAEDALNQATKRIDAGIPIDFQVRLTTSQCTPHYSQMVGLGCTVYT